MLRMIRNAVDEFVSGPDDAAPLSNNEKRLLEMVSKDPGVTAAEIAEAIGVSERTVKKYISSLSNRGYIKREGGDKTGRWIIVHN